MIATFRCHIHLMSLCCVIASLLGCSVSSDGRSIWKMIDDYDDVAIAKYIEEGGNISSAGILKPPPVLYSMDAGNMKCFQAILKGKPNLNFTYGLRDLSIMNLAAANPDSFWLRELIKHGGDVNFDDHAGKFKRYPPLVHAAYAGNLENVKLLVEAGADIELCLDGYVTALPVAVGSNHFDIAYYLLEKGADYRRRLRGHWSLPANMRGKDPQSVRSEKLRNENQRVIDWLQERGIDYRKSHWEGDYLVWTEE